MAIGNRLIDDMAARLWGVNSYTNEQPQRDIVGDLERVAEMLASRPPMPVGVWFIDRMDLFYRLEAACHSYTVPDPKESAYISGFMGTHVYAMTLQELQQRVAECQDDDYGGYVDSQMREDMLRRTFPVREPGVWIVWSNGAVTEVTVDDPFKAKGVECMSWG